MMGAARRHSIRIVATTATATPILTSLEHVEIMDVCSLGGTNTIKNKNKCQYYNSSLTWELANTLAIKITPHTNG